MDHHDDVGAAAADAPRPQESVSNSNAIHFRCRRVERAALTLNAFTKDSSTVQYTLDGPSELLACLGGALGGADYPLQNDMSPVKNEFAENLQGCMINIPAGADAFACEYCCRGSNDCRPAA